MGLVLTLGLVVALVAGAIATAVGPAIFLLLGALVLAAVLLRYPPLLLAAFLFVPWFESAPGIAQLPADPTLPLAGLLVALCGFRLASGCFRKVPLGFIGPVLLVGVALAIGLLWTVQAGYGQGKVTRYFTITLLAAVSPFFALRTRNELIGFLLAIVGAALVVAIITPFNEARVISGITSETSLDGRFSLGGQIFPSRFLCTAALILIFLPSFTRFRWRYLGPPLSLGVIAVAVGMGSRGPVLALVLAVAAVLALTILRAPRQLAVVLAAITLAAVPLVILQDTAPERVRGSLSDPSAILEDDRSTLYAMAIELTQDSPLAGAGTGSYAAYSGTLGKYDILYPHNFFLELSADVGIIPPVLALFPMLVGVWLALRRGATLEAGRHRQLLHVIIGLFLLALFSAQFSGDINHNRSLWTFLAILWLFARRDMTAGSEGDLRRADYLPRTNGIDE